jgi:hypothetical protein
MEHLSTEALKEKRKTVIQGLKSMNFNVLRGSLIERYKRCGKAGCKCAQGRGHGPKFYLCVSRPGGQHPEMVYVPLAAKEKVEACLKNFYLLRQQLEEISTLNRELLKRKEPFY